jgi:tRNA 2-thiouridine synthesizing protein A
MAPASGIDATWDAGDLGCGELLVLLRGRILALPPGGRLQLIARDPAAPDEIPAWARLTGHHLRESTPPVFLIERRQAT